MGGGHGKMEDFPLDVMQRAKIDAEDKKNRQWMTLMQRIDKLENHLHDQIEQQKGTNALLLKIRDELKEARQP